MSEHVRRPSPARSGRRRQGRLLYQKASSFPNTTTIEQAWRSSWAKPPAPAVETAAVAADCSCGEQVVGECEVCGQAVCPDHQESFSCDSEGTIHSECHEHSGCRSEYCWYTD